MMNASAPGTGRSAPECIGNTTSAKKNADGGTPQRKTKTGMTTTGSAATSLSRGTIARLNQLRLVMKTASATGSGRSALIPTIKRTSAAMIAAGGTPRRTTRTGRTTTGSPATSSSRGSNAAALASTRQKSRATATGTGRSALRPTGNLTTAAMIAAGGTPRRMTRTGVMTGGSPATSLIRGSIADETTRLLAC